MSQLSAVYEAVLDGDIPGARSQVEAALDAGVAPGTILKDGLIAAMAEVGRLFEEDEYFVPEMLMSAHAMQAGLALLKPHLAEASAAPAGTVVIGTVQGDSHDIGKNLVAMMLEGAGFEVVDLGINVAPDQFKEALLAHRAQVLGMSALLTTTMPAMRATVQMLREAGIREQVKVMIGGAPVTEDFARQIGADGYSPDASSAVRLARALAGR